MWCCYVPCVCSLSHSGAGCSFGVFTLGHALPSLQERPSCFSGRSFLRGLYQCIVCAFIYESLLQHVSLMTRVFWLAWFKKMARLIYYMQSSSVPGFVPSLHFSSHPRAMLISRHDDNAVLFFVGCGM